MMKKTADRLSKTFKWLLVFGMIFSEVSFPLGVLADELVNDEAIDVFLEGEDTLEEQTSTVIKVNEEETLEYTITDNKVVVITLEANDEVKSETIDFSNKLYGVYQYTFNGIEDVVTINHLGNNVDLLNKNIVDVTKEITCDTEVCIIKGFGSNEVTVGDVKEYYNLDEFITNYNASVSVTDGENELVDTDKVLNDYVFELVSNETETELENGILVNSTPKSIYTFNRVGDVFIPSDGIINVSDQETILDDILQDNELTSMNDVNGDNELNILDATDSIYLENEIEGEVTDVLTNALTSDKTELLVGDVLEVKLLVSGFDMASLYGVEGLLTYDNTMLKLVGAKLFTEEDDEYLGYLNLENGKFAYVLKNGFNNEEVALLTLSFEANAAGEGVISISNIIESYGKAFSLVNDKTELAITVLEDATGGDEPTEDVTPEEPKDDTTVEELPKEEEKTEVVVRPVVKSSDYYIKNLVIDGYEIDFDMYNYEYTVEVENDVNSLDFDVLLNSGKSIYWVEGNENFKSGENLVYLVVKAENGSTKTYTIKVLKDKEEVVKEDKTELSEDEVEEENNSSKTVIIILIILVIIGLIYVIFKDDEEDNKKEVKKTSQPEKVKSEEVKIKEVKKEAPKNTKNNNSNKNTSKNNKKTSKKK